MADEQVRVSTGGYSYEGWESAQVIQDLENPWIEFILSTTEIGEPNTWGKPGHSIFRDWNFPPGTPVEIFSTGDFVMAGLVYVYMPNLDPDRHSITVNGSTKGRNWAESSVDSKTGNWENTTDIAIIEALAEPYGVTIHNTTPPEPVPYWQIRQGGSNYFEATRLLTDYQKLLTANEKGEIVITGANSLVPFRAEGAIIQGDQVLNMTAKLQAFAFSNIDVIGQQVIGTGLQAFNVKGTGVDPTKMADRRRRIIAQRDLTPSLAQRRAEWEIMRQSGHELEATFIVRGWRDQLGQFWRPNTGVYVWAPLIQIDCVLLIKRVVLSQSIAQGTVSEITVTDPRAYGKPSTACSSGDMWLAPFASIGGGAR